MTNFNSATRSFDLCAEGTESYAWAWEGIDRDQALSVIAEENIVSYASDWARELSDACISQIHEDGERGFTAEEIKADLRDDTHALAAALQAWLGGSNEPEEAEEAEEAEDDQEPELLYEITHEIMGCWDAPATITEIEQAVAQWHTRGAEYSVKVDLGAVYVYVELDTDSDFRPSSDNWVQLDDRSSYRLEIGELYQAEEDDDQVPGQGLLLCTSSLGGRGITPASPIYVFSGEKDFRNQNPQWHWVQLPEPCWHGVTIIDIDLPVQGGYQAEWGGNPTRSADGYTYYP